MIRSTYLLLFTLIFTAWVRKRWRTTAQKRNEAIFGAKYGCRPMKTILDGKWPFGIDLITGIMTGNAKGYLLEAFTPFMDNYGPNLELRMFGNRGIVTSDPENIKAILTMSKFRRGEFDWVYGQRREALLPLLGEGLFTQDGHPWKQSREMLRKQFARIQYHNLDIFTEHIELLVERISTCTDPVIDLHPLFLHFTLDTTTSLLFGESAHSLHNDSEDEFGRSFNDATWISAIRVQLAYLYWLCYPPRYVKACNKVKEYAGSWVQKVIDAIADNDTDDEKHAFIRSLYDELGDRKLVRDQLVNVLLAGRDTTAWLLSWTFRLLLRHNEAMSRLQQEIDSVLGQDKDITKAKLQRLPYLKHVLTETLRLYPLVPINFRETNHATILPRGGGADGLSPVLVPAKMGVGYSPYFMHRREDLYGHDAQSFRPERWEDETLHERLGWAYLPFNGGPRVCLGQEFALLEASYAIVRILQTFRNMALPVDEEAIQIGRERQVISLTLSPTDGCRVKLRGS